MGKTNKGVGLWSSKGLIKRRKPSKAAKELGAKNIAACLIVVLFPAPLSSRVGGGAGEYRQDGKIGLQAPGMGAGATGGQEKRVGRFALGAPRDAAA